MIYYNIIYIDIRLRKRNPLLLRELQDMFGIARFKSNVLFYKLLLF